MIDYLKSLGEGVPPDEIETYFTMHLILIITIGFAIKLIVETVVDSLSKCLKRLKHRK